MANAGAIKAGAAFVQLFADDSALQSGLKAAEKSVKSFGVSVGKIGAGMGALGAAITAPLIAATNVFANTGSELNDMADRTGVSVEALSALGFAAEQTGTSMETVEGAVRKMQKALVAGTDESAAAAGAFAQLGLSVQRLMQLKPDEQFNTIAERIGAIKDPTARSAAALQIFGKSGTALLPMIKDLRALTQQAKDFDLIWTADEAKQADALGDSISLLNQVIKRNVTLVGAALAPSFEAWNMQMARISKTIGQFIKANQSLIVTISTVGFALVAAGTAIVTLGTVIFGLGQIIGVVSGTISVLYGVLGFILSPIGLVLVAVAGLTAAFLLYTETGQKMVASLKGGFTDLLTVGQHTFKGMADALKAGDIALAARILWAGINLEFIKGRQFVMGVWTDFTADIAREMMVLNTDLASLWVDMWAGMETIGTKAARKLSGILGMIFPDDPRISAQQEAASWEKALDDIEKKRQETQGVLSAQLEEDTAARRQDDQAQVEAARKELADAQAAFDALRGQAAAEAGGVEASGEGGMGGAPGAPPAPMTPESLDEGMKKAASKVDIAGTFSGAAATGMGAGSSIEKVAKDHLDESKKQTKELEHIKKNTDKQQVFAA